MLFRNAECFASRFSSFVCCTDSTGADLAEDVGGFVEATFAAAALEANRGRFVGLPIAEKLSSLKR